MHRPPRIPLTPDDRETVRAWTKGVFAVWTAIVVATLATPMLLNVTGAVQWQAQSAPKMQCAVSVTGCQQAAR
jgi:hypothetical protein